MNAVLALEDGTWFGGTSVGAAGETSGEVVFNTSMTGYQEVLTDPSYAGQIVTMTSVQIGNYGVTGDDAESRGPQVAGFVMRESSPVASNWRADQTLREYLTKHNIVAIADIDTRALTRKLRSGGVLRGVIGTGAGLDPQQLVARAAGIRPMEGSDLVKDVTCAGAVRMEGRRRGRSGFSRAPGAPRQAVASESPPTTWASSSTSCAGWRRTTAMSRCFPRRRRPQDLLAIEPDGIFLSNGPGDPAALPYVVDNARTLVDSDVPVFGICLGHQVLGLAMGGKTFKLKFGHRGGNHPVKNLATNKVEITSQNHGFAVDPDSLPGHVRVTHLNLYDGTVEGLRHVDKRVFCVQYHPEASPGPHDADYLFRQFLDEIEKK